MLLSVWAWEFYLGAGRWNNLCLEMSVPFGPVWLWPKAILTFKGNEGCAQIQTWAANLGSKTLSRVLAHPRYSLWLCQEKHTQGPFMC